MKLELNQEPNMNTKAKLVSPLTLDYLEKMHPNAFKELLSMDIQHRNMLFELLKGNSYCPIGRGYADIELDKEDSFISSLKVDYKIDITRKRVIGNQCKHYMSPEQIDEYLNDRESMRKRIDKQVKYERQKKLDRELRKAVKEHGDQWLIRRIRCLTANDDIFNIEE